MKYLDYGEGSGLEIVSLDDEDVGWGWGWTAGEDDAKDNNINMTVSAIFCHDSLILAIFVVLMIILFLGLVSSIAVSVRSVTLCSAYLVNSFEGVDCSGHRLQQVYLMWFNL